MEFASIDREIHVDAAPDVVFAVISRPEHVQEWWADQADFDPAPGGAGEVVWGDQETPRAHVEAITVLEADPPRRFVFRWTHPAQDPAAVENSLLVVFELEPSGAGTTLRLTETGFRERGWEAAVLEEQYRDHVSGWDFFLPRLAAYAARLAAAR